MLKRPFLLFAVILLVALAVGIPAGLRYSDHFPVTGWKTGALKATFLVAQLEGKIGQQSPVLTYQLENKTDQDYSIRDKSDIEIFVRDHGVADNHPGDAIAIDLPLYVPARQRARVTIHFRFIALNQPADASQAEVQSFLRDKKRLWNQYDEIVLRDKRQRYEIDFPMIR